MFIAEFLRKRSPLMLSSHLRLDIPNGLYSSGFQNRITTRCRIFFQFMLYMYLSIIILIGAIAVTILGNKKSSLFLVKYYAKRRTGRRGAAPLVSNLDTVWRLIGQFHAHAMDVMLLKCIIIRLIMYVFNLSVTSPPDIQVFPSAPIS